jgi:hypothetical protein
MLREFQGLLLMEGNNQIAVESVTEYDVSSRGGHVLAEEVYLWELNEADKVTHLRHYADTAKHIAAAKI